MARGKKHWHSLGEKHVEKSDELKKQKNLWRRKINYPNCGLLIKLLLRNLKKLKKWKSKEKEDQDDSKEEIRRSCNHYQNLLDDTNDNWIRTRETNGSHHTPTSKGEGRDIN